MPEISRRDFLKAAGMAAAAASLPLDTLVLEAQSTTDWIALENWANYMNQQNAFGAATSWATDFVNRWAPLVHRIANEGYNPVPADLTDLASSTYEYGLGALGDFFTYWYASPTTYNLMIWPGTENNPAGYAPSNWGLQGTVIRNVPPMKSTIQFDKNPDENTNIVITLMNNFGISPIERVDFCQSNHLNKPNSQIGFNNSMYGPVWWANPTLYTYGMTSDDHGGTTHTTDSDIADYLNNHVIGDWVAFRGIVGSFVEGLSIDCASAVKMVKVLILSGIMLIMFHGKAVELLGEFLGELVIAFLDVIIPLILVSLVILASIIAIKHCTWSYS